jgi:hypothetical protein
MEKMYSVQKGGVTERGEGNRVYRTKGGTKWDKVTHEVTNESRETFKNYLLTR